MKHKKIIAVLIVLTLLISMATACGNSESKAPATDTKAAESGDKTTEKKANDEAVTLRINWWGGQKRADITQDVIEMYKEKHSNVTINPEFTSFDGYWEKMAAMSAANRLPDVFQHDLRYMKHYVDKDLLLDMTSYIDNGFDTSDISQVLLDGGTFDDKLYGVPLGTNVLCIMYDPVMFEEAGLAVPTNDWTWEEYVQACYTIREKLDIYGDGEFPGIGYNGWNFVLKQSGQSLYTEDGESLGFTDDTPLIEMLDLYKELYNADVILPPSVVIEIQDAESEFIVTERAAMASAQWSNSFATMIEVAERDLNMVLPPNGAEQAQYGNYIKPAQFFTVAQSSQVPDQAVDFVDFFTNDVEANLVLQGERGVPINGKVRDALAEQLGDTDREVFQFLEDAEAYATDIPAAPPTIHSEVESLISTIQFQLEDGTLADGAAAVAFFREEVAKLYANRE